MDGGCSMEKEIATGLKVNKEGRLAGLDILRSLAMFMVVVLHYLDKGDLLVDLSTPDMGSLQHVAWILETLCIVAVNVYMLISGFFMCKSNFKLSRLIGLWIQLECYSVGIGILPILLGWMPEQTVNVYYLLGLVFPVSMGHYWFMTAYIYMYILFAFIGPALRNMEKRQFQIAIGGLLVVLSLVKSLLPVHLEMDKQGYDCLWYLCVFLVGAYIRKYGIAFLQKRRNCIFLYLGGCGLIYGISLMVRGIYLQTGSLSYILTNCYNYNHILNLITAIGLFGLFAGLQARESLGRFFGRLAPYVLGVYLVHENQGIRYEWQKYFGSGQVSNVVQLILTTIAAALVVFVVGVAIEWCRKKVIHVSHVALQHISPYRKLYELVLSADEKFKK